MDLHKYQVTLRPNTLTGIQEKFVGADEVVVVDNFVMLVITDDDGNVERCVAIFNVSDVMSVMEVNE